LAKTRTESESEQSTEYFNFINSLNAEHTKIIYVQCLEKFLNYCELDLHSFLMLSQQLQEKTIIEYLVRKRVSATYKNVILATIRHACEVNDVVVLNWKKIKNFIRSSQKTGNEISGKDRGYTHEEIQKILEFSDQRIKTAFLILASTGMRIGGLGPLKVGDLQRITDIYKVTVYSGKKEQYITFTTPEAAKEITAYLQFRKRRGEHITSDSYVIVKKFSYGKSEPYKGYSLRSVLQDTIENSGLKEVGSKFRRKETPLLHAFRKFFTKQLLDNNVKAEIREMLLGHKIGLISAYYKPTEKEMLNEYYKVVPLLTISDEERLKFKLEERIQIQKTTMQSMQEEMNKFKEELAILKRKRK
jgi:integrase